MGVLVPDTISKMLRKLMTSPRFRNMTLNGYTALLDDSIEQQFAALTIDLGNGSIYISFRGTDDTIVGWKEDLNMGFLEEIPSQKQAVEYVARVARQYSDKTIRIGGHSKGGNLAVYSAAKSSGEIQERIVAVHNNDGPGFAWDISETPGHKRIASRIHTILPQTSVVGMLMEHEKRYQVVHSTYDGLYQHDGFSWQVLGTQFNVTAYADERICRSTLVEGSVRIVPDSGRDGEEIVLTPGEQVVHETGTDTFSVARVNTKVYTAWMDREFVFENTPLSEALRIVSRWYDFRYDITDSDLEKYTFTGQISKDGGLDYLFRVLYEAHMPIVLRYEDGVLYVDRR